jgi:sugar lactone lactonase YvrE
MAVKKLPYKNLAGITVAAEEAFVVKRLADVVDDRPTFDAATMLWTARRQSGRAISRFPLDPTGDNEGIGT